MTPRLLKALEPLFELVKEKPVKRIPDGDSNDAEITGLADALRAAHNRLSKKSREGFEEELRDILASAKKTRFLPCPTNPKSKRPSNTPTPGDANAPSAATTASRADRLL